MPRLGARLLVHAPDDRRAEVEVVLRAHRPGRRPRRAPADLARLAVDDLASSLRYPRPAPSAGPSRTMQRPRPLRSRRRSATARRRSPIAACSSTPPMPTPPERCTFLPIWAPSRATQVSTASCDFVVIARRGSGGARRTTPRTRDGNRTRGWARPRRRTASRQRPNARSRKNFEVRLSHQADRGAYDGQSPMADADGFARGIGIGRPLVHVPVRPEAFGPRNSASSASRRAPPRAFRRRSWA